MDQSNREKSMEALASSIEVMQILQIPSIITSLRQQVELYEGLKLKMLDHPIAGVAAKLYDLYSLTISLEVAHEAYLLQRWPLPMGLPENEAFQKMWFAAAQKAGILPSPQQAAPAAAPIPAMAPTPTNKPPKASGYRAFLCRLFHLSPAVQAAPTLEEQRLVEAEADLKKTMEESEEASAPEPVEQPSPGEDSE